MVKIGMTAIYTCYITSMAMITLMIGNVQDQFLDSMRLISINNGLVQQP